MRILAGDIGGTHSRFAVFRLNDGQLEQQRRLLLASADHADADAMLAACAAQLGDDTGFDAACLAVAGPVRDGVAQLTNLPWRIDADTVRRHLACGQVTILNDFEALAHAVAGGVAADDLVALLDRPAAADANRVVLGPGTGLGVGLLVRHGGSWCVVATEGGHADFAPRGQEQMRLLHFLQARHDHVSYERVLSGPGIEAIHGFFRSQAGDTGNGPEAVHITRAALQGDELALRTMRLFVEALGAFAGNLALLGMARGGLFIAGGIAPAILPLLGDGRFADAFHDKGRMCALLESVPVSVITGDDAGLHGAALYCLRQR